MTAATAALRTVTLGHVARPNGLTGAIVLHVDPSMASVIQRGLEIELVPKSGNSMRSRIRSAAPLRGGVRVTLDDVEDRNAAEALVGAAVLVSRETPGLLAEGEYLDSDLVGLDVVTQGGARLGRVVEIIATGANDVYVVRSDADGEILVPAVAHAVVSVDLASRVMTVDATALEYPEPGK